MKLKEKIYLILILFSTFVILLRYNTIFDSKSLFPETFKLDVKYLDVDQNILIDTAHSEKNIQDIMPTHINRKQIVYLMQTEQCIPENYTRKETLGDSIECMCDVIVLSYKQKCSNSTLVHVKYITQDSTSWGSGRNLLYNTAISRNESYLYYIFMDGDVELIYNDKYAPVEIKSISPWRAFEQFLIDHEPVVGVTNYQHHHDSEEIIKSFHQICSPHIKPNEELPSNRTFIGTELPLYLTVVTFDGMFNAYHRDAGRDLLPYILTYDDQNWSYAQFFQFSKVELMFRGQAVMYTPVNANNPLHTEYPKDLNGVTERWGNFIRYIAKDIPLQYSNESWIKQFADDPLVYKESNSSTFCYKFPPKHPIRKYSHFSFKWTL